NQAGWVEVLRIEHRAREEHREPEHHYDRKHGQSPALDEATRLSPMVIRNDMWLFRGEASADDSAIHLTSSIPAFYTGLSVLSILDLSINPVSALGAVALVGRGRAVQGRGRVVGRCPAAGERHATRTGGAAWEA